MNSTLRPLAAVPVMLMALFLALFLAVFLALFPAPVSAQTFDEKPYDPPAGSRWQIVSQTDSEDDRGPGQHRDQHIHSVGELTIEEKLADGYRISYANRGITLSGNAPGTEIAGTAFGALKDIVVRVRTDRAGMPVTVENIEEVRATMQRVIDRMTEAFKSNPKVGEVIRQLLEAFLTGDGVQGARMYVEDVPLLAAAQNTGLKPGAVRRENEVLPNPLGGAAIKSTLAMRLTAWDNGAGTARYTRTREIDAEAMKSFVIAVARKLSSAASDKITPELVEMMKRITFETTSETVFDVKNGMTYAVTDRDTTKISLMGHTFTKLETKTVSVKPLAKSP